jgi:Ala-tRNA(Pro) deacylase
MTEDAAAPPLPDPAEAEAALAETLAVRPGAVTPLALLAPSAAAVRLILDAHVAASETINVHPLHNEATIALATADLLALLAEAGHAPLILDLGPPADPA